MVGEGPKEKEGGVGKMGPEEGGPGGLKEGVGNSPSVGIDPWTLASMGEKAGGKSQAGGFDPSTRGEGRFSLEIGGEMLGRGIEPTTCEVRVGALRGTRGAIWQAFIGWSESQPI